MHRTIERATASFAGMLLLRLARTTSCVLIESRAEEHVMRVSQHPALHACTGLVLTCSPADRAEHHAFAVRRPSWIDLRPASDVNRLNTPRSTSRKPDVHAPLLPFGVATPGHPVKAQVRSNFRSRSADVSHLPAGSIKPCELTLPYCCTRTVKRLYGEARRMRER